MNPVLLDTCPIVALLDRSEQRHYTNADLISRLEAPFYRWGRNRPFELLLKT